MDKLYFKFSAAALLLFSLTLAACNVFGSAEPTPLPTLAPQPTVVPAQPEATSLPPTDAPTDPAPVSDHKTYTNDEFGLAFEYPNNWFGPTEYVSENMLRLEIGSDVVYPYGTDPTTRVYELTNSYTILIQFSKNDQNTYWKDAYDAVADLEPGASNMNARTKVIKVRDLEMGRFKGAEYISTLSETAQTEPLYMRNVVLFDDESNVITLMGQPHNVLLGDGLDWRTEYQRIDDANAGLFREILESIQVN